MAALFVEAVIAIAGIAYGIYSSRKSHGDLSAGPTRLSGVRFQTSAYGGVVPLIYGRNRISGNLIWYGAFRAIAQTTSGGGKGGGSQTYTTGYTYTASIALALGFGTIAHVAQVFRDKKVIQGRATAANTLYRAAEAWAVPAGSPHQVTVSGAASWQADLGATYNGVALVAGTDYTVAAGVYTFLTHFGNTVSIAYSYLLSSSWQSALSQAGLSLFSGAPGQTPWPYLTTQFPGQDLAYRGIAYISGQDYDLGTAGTLGNHSFEVDGNLQYGAIPGAQAFTVNASTSTLTSTGNLFVNGMPVKLSTTGVLPHYLQAGQIYWVVNVAGNNYQLSLSKGGAAFKLANDGSGSGTHTATPQVVDCNPKDIVTDLDTQAGGGTAAVPLGTLTDFSNFCVAAGLFCSPYYSGQKSAAELLTQLFTIANTAPYFSEGVLKAVPLTDQAVTGNGATFTPNTTAAYDLTDDDFLPGDDAGPVVFTRKSQADAYNHVQVKFNNRANNYNEEVVEAKDQANIDIYGLRTMPPVSMPEITELAVARAVAQLLLQRVLYIRNQWTFRLPEKYVLLEPTDIVTLTDSVLGLNRYPVRILSIDEDVEGFVVTAEDFLNNVGSSPAYPSQVSAGALNDLNVDPGNTNAPLIMEGPDVLTVSGFELWVALSGGANWGGAQVWVSTDQATYTQLGTVYGPARYGTLTATFGSGTDPDTADVCSVDLTISGGSLSNGSSADADGFSTLCYCDGELIAYSIAQLTAANKYDLKSYIRRGVYNTPIGAHSSGANFARLDSAIGKFAYNPALVGQTVYLKFVSFNQYGYHLQDISQVQAYTYTIVGGLGAPNDVQNFTATQQGNLVLFTWTGLTAANISGYEIRYLPQGVSGLTWSDGTELTKVTKGTQITSARLPPGDWTCLIKAVDDSLRYSVNAATANVGMANTYQIVEQAAQQPDWPGTLVNCYMHWTGVLVPLSTVLASNNDGVNGYAIFDNYVYQPVSSMSYTAPEVDLGSDGQARLYALPRAVLGPGVSSGSAGKGAVSLQYRTAAGSYGGFQPWSIGSVTCRYFQAKLDYDLTQGLVVVQQFVETADDAQLVTNGNLVTIAAGGTAIAFPQHYFNPPSVTANVDTTSGGSGGGITVIIRNVTATGFTASVLDKNNADVGGVINWAAIGV